MPMQGLVSRRDAASGPAAKGPAELRRRNTWTWPPSFRWLLSVAVSLANAVLVGAFLLPLLHHGARWGFLGGFVVSWTVMVAAALRVTNVDPIDQILCKDSAGEPRDSTELILYCRHCSERVGVTSKHCFQCNKCISGFDHHCPYMNTCIGDRNYWSFYVTTWAALVMLGVTVAAAVTLLAHLCFEGGERLQLYGMGEVQLGMVLAAVLLVNIPLLLLDSVLVAFHTYLCFVQLTTYDFLTGKATTRKAMLLRQKQREAKGSGSSSELKVADVTQVAPQHNLSSEANEDGEASTRSASLAVSPSQARDEDGGSQVTRHNACTEEGGGQRSRECWLHVAQDELDIKKSITSALFGSELSRVCEPGSPLTVSNV